MKSRKQIDDARAIMRRRIITPGLTDLQKATVLGVSNALQWVAGVGNSTVERLLSDEPMAPGKEAPHVFERLSQLPRAVEATQLLADAVAGRDGWKERAEKFLKDHLR